MELREITIVLVALLLSMTRIAGQTFNVLHTFTGSTDGANPTTGMLLSSNKLFGSTISGGTADWGTIFSLNTDGSDFTLLDTITNTVEGDEFNKFTRFGNMLLTTAQQGGPTESGR
jgi:uncharacterized repeat protein (TIGR03803 family)